MSRRRRNETTKRADKRFSDLASLHIALGENIYACCLVVDVAI